MKETEFEVLVEQHQILFNKYQDLKKELDAMNEEYNDLNDSYDRIQGVYQNEHCDLIQAKAELEKVKEISKEKIEELEKEYKILRTLNASSAYDYDKLDKKYKKTLQENVELKAYKDVNEDFKTAWEELKAENERLKEELAENNCFEPNSLKCKHAFFIEDKLKQTLQEIKAIAETAINGGYATKSDDYSEGMEIIGHYVMQKITKAEEE